MAQINFFDMEKEPIRITKPIRLIELFAGYGSQSLALKYLGVPFEHWRISEWAINSIKAYKDLHHPNNNYDYSASKTDAEILDWLTDRISSDYSTPLSADKLRKKAKELRGIYNDMLASHNLGSICKMRGGELDITDTDKFTYIMTYSFPCQ